MQVWLVYVGEYVCQVYWVVYFVDVLFGQFELFQQIFDQVVGVVVGYFQVYFIIVMVGQQFVFQGVGQVFYVFVYFQVGVVCYLELVVVGGFYVGKQIVDVGVDY